MEIVVIGSHEFTLGFQLAGVTRLYHPSTEKEMESTINDLLKDSTVGIIVVDNSDPVSYTHLTLPTMWYV